MTPEQPIQPDALQKAVQSCIRKCAEELLKNPDDLYVIKAISESFEPVISAAKRLQEVEKERDDWRNAGMSIASFLVCAGIKTDGIKEGVQVLVKERDALKVALLECAEALKELQDCQIKLVGFDLSLEEAAKIDVKCNKALCNPFVQQVMKEKP